MSDSWRQLADRYNTTIEEIKQRLPIEWVIAIAAGIQLVHGSEGRSQGLCPFHPDTNPSLDIYADGTRWGCFPCGRGGDVFDFIGEYWELQSFPARFEKAIELLHQFEEEGQGWESAIQQAAPSKPATVAEIAPEVQTAQHIMRKETVKPVRDLLERKHLDVDIDWLRDHWRLGVTAQQEILAGYWDTDGTLVSYKTRRADRGGWFTRRGTKLTSLYGEWQLQGTLAEAPIWLCEGETDTWLASWLIRGRGVALGLPAGAGSHIREEWIEICRGKRITIVFDADRAGRNAAESWWTQLNGIAQEISISFPESDLAESRRPLDVLMGGRVVTRQSGFLTEEADGRAYREITAQGNAGPITSNFTFEATKHIDYRDTLGQSLIEGWEGHFKDQRNSVVRIRATDLADARHMREWAIRHGRSWYGASARHTQALLDHLQAQTPFLKEEIAVPISGLWGTELGHSVFVLPDASGGSLGSPIGKERWSFSEGVAKYDIGSRYRLGEGRVDHDVLRELHLLHLPGVTTPIIAWLTAAPLRSLVTEFPPLAVLGGSGSGKTSLTKAFMAQVFGWQGSEQNLTNTTPYAVKQASAASNGLPIWWDEYRRGARRDTFQAMGQVIRDSWTAGVSTRGGVGDDLSRIEITAAVAPLILSGEAGLEEKSHQDRVIVVRLPLHGRNPDALDRVMDDVAGTGGGVLGRALIEWQLAGLDAQDPLFLAGAPRRRDRQEQGLAVLQWGWDMWKRFLADVFEINLEWDLDLSVVTAERERSQEIPEIEALIEMLQQRTKWKLDDRTPVAWIEDETSDVVRVRKQAFYNAATRDGFVLPGGPGATLQVLMDRFPSVGDRTRYEVLGDSFQVRAEGLSGFLSYAREQGVDFTARGEWE